MIVAYKDVTVNVTVVYNIKAVDIRFVVLNIHSNCKTCCTVRVRDNNCVFSEIIIKGHVNLFQRLQPTHSLTLAIKVRTYVATCIAQ